MPVRNEAHWIVHSLHAVLRQDYPRHKLEIIIADGMSSDATLAVIQKAAEDAPVRVLINPKRIQAAGLNLAIQYAKGDVIIRVDARTIIAPDYVHRCVEALRESGAQNVGGRINPIGITAMGRAIAAASTSSFAVPSAFRTSNTARFVDTVYLGAWHRADLIQIGGFDEHLSINEDYELNYRLRRAGGKVFLSPRICSHYYGSQTLRKLARQYFRYGCWKPYTLALHPASLKARHIVAPAFTAYLVLCVTLGTIVPTFRSLWMLSIAIYTICALSAAVIVGWKERSLLWRLPLVFPVMHFSWGIGFWVGVLRRIRAGENT